MHFSVEYIIWGIFMYAILRIIYKGILKLKNKKISLFAEIVSFILAICMIIIFSITISPIYGFHTEIHLDWGINLVPFYTIRHTINNILAGQGGNTYNLFGNIVMFIPMGIAFPIISCSYQKMYRTVLAGAGISCFIEICQLFLTRGTDIDDVILNTAGMFIGYLIFKMMTMIYPPIRNQCGIQKKEEDRIFYCKKDGIFILILIIVTAASVYQTGFSMKARNVQESYKYDYSLLNISAEHIAVYSVSENQFIYARGETSKLSPASTTKLLTAMVVLDHCNVNEEVMVGDEIRYVEPDASRANLRQGNCLNIKMLLEALLLPSGNDAAYTLAVYTGNKILKEKGLSNTSQEEAIKTFVAAMNEKAQSIGAKNSQFKRPDGYDQKGQFTTIMDMTYIARKAIEYNELEWIVSRKSIRELFLDGQDVTYQNTNQLMNEQSQYFFKDVRGMKTGYSKNAGYCLVSSAVIHGKTYIVVNMKDTKEGRYRNSLEVYKWLDNILD